MKIKLIEGGKLPLQATEGSACYDVFAREIIKESDNFYRIKLGFACEVPENHRLMLQLRSSATKFNWVMINQPGIIDSDFRNEVELRLRGIPIGFQIIKVPGEWTIDEFGNEVTTVYDKVVLEYEKFPFEVNGNAVGQIYLEQITPMNFELVEELSETDRKGGFGSTNK